MHNVTLNMRSYQIVVNNNSSSFFVFFSCQCDGMQKNACYADSLCNLPRFQQNWFTVRLHGVHLLHKLFSFYFAFCCFAFLFSAISVMYFTLRMFVELKIIIGNQWFYYNHMHTVLYLSCKIYLYFFLLLRIFVMFFLCVSPAPPIVLTNFRFGLLSGEPMQ